MVQVPSFVVQEQSWEPLEERVLALSLSPVFLVIMAKSAHLNQMFGPEQGGASKSVLLYPISQRDSLCQMVTPGTPSVVGWS